MKLIKLIALVLLSATVQAQTDEDTIVARAGALQAVNVSSRMVNEIVAPFENPKLVKFIREDSAASIVRDGRSIYVSTGNEEFIQLIIKDQDNPSHPGLSLHLRPVDDMPARYLRFEFEGSAVGGAGASSELSTSDYIDLVRELMRDASQDNVPSGYTKDGSWQGTRIQVGDVIGEPAKRLVGNSLAVEYFVLKNTGPEAIQLHEPNFMDKGVRAIAFIDHHILQPNTGTRMIWIRDRKVGESEQ